MSMYIGSLATTAGFLQPCPTKFSRGLTCIIGARGTCKSTLMESIRFAFERDPDRLNTLLGADPRGDGQAKGIIRATLGPGTVRCSVILHEAESTTALTLEREAGNDPPRIYCEGIREMEASISNTFCLKYF
jgi:hypothetical protein